jgi:branched-chain amino acid transport system permease protein
VSSYLAQLLVDASLGVMLAVGLGIVYGHAGILSLCHASFFGAGAYAAALLSPFLAQQAPAIEIVGILGAGIAGGAIVSVIVGVACLPLRGDFVALATLAIGELLRALVVNAAFMGGAGGIAGIPRLTTPTLAIGAAVVSIFVARVYLQSPSGRISEGVRDNADWISGLAAPGLRVKFSSFILGAAIAGAAGALFACRQQYIGPNSFGLMPSITILLAVILGGRGNLTGCVIGAMVVTLLPETLRFAEDWRPFAMGALLLLTSAHFTHGVLGRRLYQDPLRRWPRPSGAWEKPLSRSLGSGEEGCRNKRAMLKVMGMRVRTRYTDILNGVCLDVEGGKPLALIGTNGSGKTTLAKALAGVVPSTGRLSLDSEIIRLYPRSRQQRKRVLYVPQHPQGFHRMSALDNVRIAVDRDVSFPSCLTRLPFVHRERDRRSRALAEAALSWVDLADRADVGFANLSYGQRKRVLLATALLAEPEVLILDEPFAGLNTGAGSEAETVVNALAARLQSVDRITIIIDHRLELLKPLCPNLALLDAGKIVEQGAMSALTKTPVFRQIYEQANTAS